jgi:heterodisulfide reductase subunit A2
MIEEIFRHGGALGGAGAQRRASELADTIGVELNSTVRQTSDLAPVATNREGIYVCGVFQGPKDIPQSVMEASAAAAAAGS